MFVRIKTRKNKSGTVRKYLQIVKNSYVDGKTKQKVICTLGRLDLFRKGELDRLIKSLVKYADPDIEEK